MLHTIFGGKCHFLMSGHLCLTIYKMGDLWNVASCINKIRTWNSPLRSWVPISKFWWHINFVNIAKKWLSKNNLVLSNHEIWPEKKRYSSVPPWEGSHLDFTTDFPNCSCNWLFRKTFWNDIWMLVLQESDKSQIFYWSSQTALGSPGWLIVDWWIVNHAQKP